MIDFHSFHAVFCLRIKREAGKSKNEKQKKGENALLGKCEKELLVGGTHGR
jgi:hypothetical protein